MLFKILVLILTLLKISCSHHQCANEENESCEIFKQGFDPIIISGPSGAGKSVVISDLIKIFPEKFEFSIYHKKRYKRENEIDNLDYYLITFKKFEEMVEKGEFLEHEVNYHNKYGTSIR